MSLWYCPKCEGLRGPSHPTGICPVCDSSMGVATMGELQSSDARPTDSEEGKATGSATACLSCLATLARVTTLEAEIATLKAAVFTSERFRAEDAMSHIEDLNAMHQRWKGAEARVNALEVENKALTAERDDYRQVYEDQRRNLRALDVAMHGEAGAADSPSACDLIGPARHLRARVEAAEARADATEAEHKALKVKAKQAIESLTRPGALRADEAQKDPSASRAQARETSPQEPEQQNDTRQSSASPAPSMGISAISTETAPND